MPHEPAGRPQTPGEARDGVGARPRLLDLFCGAGGAAMGYHRAGFDVVGVDIKPQPHYPFEFHQADALTFPLDGFDAIHASPPCQANIKGLAAVNRAQGREYAHVDLIPQTRERLAGSGLSWVIENVVGAALREPVVLCGSSFAQPVRRHRLFESNVFLMVPPCAHGHYRERRYWNHNRPNRDSDGKRIHQRSTVVQVYGDGGERSDWGPAMGIDWMTPAELALAIPPAYTEWIGAQLLRAITSERAA